MAGNDRYLRWQDILCSVTPVPKLIIAVTRPEKSCLILVNNPVIG
jgi:hypothetical protein